MDSTDSDSPLIELIFSLIFFGCMIGTVVAFINMASHLEKLVKIMSDIRRGQILWLKSQNIVLDDENDLWTKFPNVSPFDLMQREEGFPAPPPDSEDEDPDRNS